MSDLANSFAVEKGLLTMAKSELKDVLQLIKKEQGSETASGSMESARERLMNSPDLEDVIIGSADGPQIPAKFDKQARIFIPLFKKAK